MYIKYSAVLKKFNKFICISLGEQVDDARNAQKNKQRNKLTNIDYGWKPIKENTTIAKHLKKTGLIAVVCYNMQLKTNTFKKIPIKILLHCIYSL